MRSRRRRTVEGSTGAQALHLGRGRALLALLLTISFVGSACDTAPIAMRDLPLEDHERAAILVVRTRDCDSNLQLFDVFDRAEVDGSLPLVAVVPLDEQPDASAIRSALRAFDVRAPLRMPSVATRDSLRTLTKGVDMSVVVFRRGRVEHVVRPPRFPDERAAFIRSILTLAQRHSDGGTR